MTSSVSYATVSTIHHYRHSVRQHRCRTNSHHPRNLNSGYNSYFYGTIISYSSSTSITAHVTFTNVLPFPTVTTIATPIDVFNSSQLVSFNLLYLPFPQIPLFLPHILNPWEILQKKTNMEAYKEGIKHLTNEQLLDSREILYAELKKAEETVAFTQGKLKALNDLMAEKGMGLATRVEEQERQIAELERIQKMRLEALQV
jgi:hypothetical protein